MCAVLTLFFLVPLPMEDTPRPVIDTKIDPRDDLDGYLHEVIAGVRSMGVAGHRRHPGHKYSHIDFQRGNPGEWHCPLWDEHPRQLWVVGQFRRTRVLAVALCDDDRLCCASFDTTTSCWHREGVIPTATRNTTIRRIVCSRDTDTVVVCTDTAMFIQRGDPLTQPLHTVHVGSVVMMVAVSHDGTCIAYVTSNMPTRVRVYWSVYWSATQTDRISSHYDDPVNIQTPIGALAFSEAMRLAVASENGREVAIVSANTSLHQLADTDCVMEMSCSPAALMKRAVEAARGPQLPLDEPVLWVAMPNDHSVATGTWHHLSMHVLSNLQHSRFVADEAAPVAVAMLAEHFLFMDAGGTTHCYQYGSDEEPCFLVDGANDERPTPRDTIQPPINCACRLCSRRLNWTAHCGRGVIVADDDLRTVWMVDPWGRVTVVRRRVC